MKKLSLIFTVLALLGTSISCKKESSKLDLSPTSQLSADLLLINQKHKFPSHLMEMTDAEKSARTAATIAADAIGAVEGASAGGKVGAFVGGFLGLGAGAGFGAGIGGALASYMAWKALTHDVPAPPGDDAEAEAEIVNFAGSYATSNPYSNPYEYVGSRHNQLLTSLFARGAVVPQTIDTFIIYDTTDLASAEKTILRADTPEWFIDNFNWSANNLPDNAGQIARACGQDQTLTTIVTAFINGLSGVNTMDLNDVMTYVNDYEDYFMTYNGVNADQKRILMCTFATAKHSAALWINAMNAVQ